MRAEVHDDGRQALDVHDTAKPVLIVADQVAWLIALGRFLGLLSVWNIERTSWQVTPRRVGAPRFHFTHGTPKFARLAKFSSLHRVAELQPADPADVMPDALAAA